MTALQIGSKEMHKDPTALANSLFDFFENNNVKCFSIIPYIRRIDNHGKLSTFYIHKSLNIEFYNDDYDNFCKIKRKLRGWFRNHTIWSIRRIEDQNKYINSKKFKIYLNE